MLETEAGGGKNVWNLEEQVYVEQVNALCYELLCFINWNDFVWYESSD